MSVGMDCGTYHIVVCKRDKDNSFVYKKEVNAFIEIPIENRFVFNMMKDAGVPLIERKDDNVAYALGEAAIQIAYTMNQIELRRPMKDGCLNPKEKHARQIMSIMIHGLLDNIHHQNETLFYSVPANAINEETDSDYHGKVLDAIFKAFQDENGYRVKPYPINEGLALIYAELATKHWTGIGCSFGAGLVNMCFSMFGNPIFQFSIANCGDWVDRMTAKATGESIAYINKEKLKLNLSESSSSLVQRAIKAQYEIMVQKAINGIKKGLEETSNKARSDNPIDIVISGGTATPPGFENLFKEILEKSKLPIQVGNIIKPKDTLLSVARGALLAAEAMDKS